MVNLDQGGSGADGKMQSDTGYVPEVVKDLLYLRWKRLQKE